jgi:hypothetical protein
MNFAMESFSEEVGRESRSVSRLARVLMEAAGVAIEECGDDDADRLQPALLKRKTVVHVRQSTQAQIHHNLEANVTV